TQYSQLVLLSNSGISFQVRSVQNPFTDQINIELIAPATGNATITLTDLFGRPVRRLIQPIGPGLNTINVYGLGSLPDAAYALQLQYRDQLVSQKVVKIQAPRR